jgi:hypothetical protein
MWEIVMLEGTNHTPAVTVERLCRRRQPARLPEVGEVLLYNGLGESTFSYSATILRVIILAFTNFKTSIAMEIRQTSCYGRTMKKI